MRQTLSEWAGGPLGQVQRERENVLSLVRVAVPGIIESDFGETVSGEVDLDLPGPIIEGEPMGG
jgi:hypothetical protein